MLAIKGLQRDVDITRGALLAERPRLNRNAEALLGKRAQPLAPMSPAASADDTGATRSEDLEMSPATWASRQHVHQEVSNLREEVKSWLDHLSESVHNSLRSKVYTQSLVGADKSASLQRQAKFTPNTTSEAGATFDTSNALRNNW